MVDQKGFARHRLPKSLRAIGDKWLVSGETGSRATWMIVEGLAESSARHAGDGGARASFAPKGWLMGLSQFFIERPVFAWVIAIVIALMGVLAIRTLPITQYPTIAPPAVTIVANYPGASAQTVQNSVTQVIEQQLTGVDNLLYFSSSSSSSGQVQITATFAPGTNPDIAQVQVQNKVQQAIAILPQEVQQQGVVVEKSQSSFLLIVALYAATGGPLHQCRHLGLPGEQAA